MIPPAKDYVTVMMRSDWSTRPWQMLGFTAIGLASVCLFAYGIAERWPEIGYFSLIPLAFLLPLFHATQKYQQFTYYRPVCFHTAEIGEDRISFVAGTLQDVTEVRALQYRWLLKVRETRRVILLYFNPSRAFVVPKAGFGPKELKQFRELIHSHMPASTTET